MSNEGMYNTISSVYDKLDYPFERLFYQQMREDFLSDIKNKDILEIGVGTGKNLPYYDRSNYVIAIDQSIGMLYQANKRLKSLDAPNFKLGLVGQPPLLFDDNSFDYIVASFVIYTEKDPTLLLKEILRVGNNNCKLIIFEYKQPKHQIIYSLVKLLSPITQKLYGVNFQEINTLTYLRKYWMISYYKEYLPHLLYGAIAKPISRS